MDNYLADLIKPKPKKEKPEEVQTIDFSDYKGRATEYFDIIAASPFFKDRFQSRVEEGAFPCLVVSKADGLHPELFKEDESLAEELLIRHHQILKADTKQVEELTYRDMVNNAIEEYSDGTLMRKLYEFVGLVEYSPTYCEPIIKADPTFFSMIEAEDSFNFLIQKITISLLGDIRTELRSIKDVLEGG